MKKGLISVFLFIVVFSTFSFSSMRNIIFISPDSLYSGKVTQENDSSFNPLNLEILKKDYFVEVAGGTFLRGSTDGQGDELPMKEITLDTFYIGRYEVTQSDWEKIMSENPSSIKGTNLPVDNVSWDQIQVFIKKLNALNPISLHYYRLPTEAEWEFAARGGLLSRGTLYAGSDEMDSVAWHRDNSNHELHSVGSKLPNELGIYDMTGNVWEFVSDWYDAKYYSVSPTTNPKGPEKGELKVIRGGGAFHNYSMNKVFIRFSKYPNYPNPYIGFRLVRDIIIK